MIDPLEQCLLGETTERPIQYVDSETIDVEKAKQELMKLQLDLVSESATLNTDITN